MKVNVYVTEEISDEERKKISEVLGVRQASRDEIKAFLWSRGEHWRESLTGSPEDAIAPDELAELL